MFLPSTVTLRPRAWKRSLTCLGQAQAETLGEHHDPERTADGDPLEHRGLQDVHQPRQPDRIVAGELLGDHREGRGGPGGLEAEGRRAARQLPVVVDARPPVVLSGDCVASLAVIAGPQQRGLRRPVPRGPGPRGDEHPDSKNAGP
jgi:hypothetical protein